MKPYTLDLTKKAACREEHSGGKGANLARLIQCGFLVPSGFVITTEAFRELKLESKLAALIEKGTPSPAELASIHDLILAAPVPDPVERQIQRAFRELGGPVAVRSSMIGEDHSGSSFAGQLDTLLGVAGEKALLDAVRTCWASLFGPRLWQYREHRAAAAPGGSMPFPELAVVVQRMADAHAAGVAFSADPITGQPQIVIEAVAGLGTELVQGLVEPDRYVVDGGRLQLQSATSASDEAVLSPEQIVQLAEIVRHAATQMDGPQDVEWAWDGTDFYLLQSRPISSLTGQKVYSASMVSDMLPGLIKPLVWSVSTTSMLENVLGRVFTELVGPNDIDFRKLAKRIHSRLYADSTLIGQLLKKMGLPANFFEMMSLDATAERRGRPPMTFSTLRIMWRLARFGWRHAWMADEIDTFIERHDGQLERYRQADWSSQSTGQLLAHADELGGLYSETMWFNFAGLLNMMGRNRMMSRLVQRHAPEVPPTDMVRGLTGLKSLETNQALQRLAAQARALGPEISALLMEQDETRTRTELAATPEGLALAAGVDQFLDRFGFLSACGTDLSRTPWSDNPTVIWRSIGRMAAQPAISATRQTEQARKEAQAHVQARLSVIQRIAFDRLLRSTITYIDLRERSSFLISEDSFQLRRIYLALADHLVAQGKLHQRDDVFYLEHDELRDLVRGDLSPEKARARIAECRAEMALDAELEIPDMIYGDQALPQPVLPAEGEACLTGISGSSGVVEGHARIILDPVQAHTPLGSEDILIIPFADTSWTPLFCGVGGVVAETGGQLSHSSIVAREYGLPAVVNVKNATRLIREGQTIIVDGNRGRVVLRER
jgi:pyruvate,water dikinase